MKEIKWLYLLDNRGAPILIYKNEDQETLSTSISILSHFLFGLKLNSRDQEDDIKFVEIENDRYYLIEDINIDSTFIMKTFWLSDKDKIVSLMKEIKSTYSKYFGDKSNIDFQKKQEIFVSFREEISRLIQNKV